MDTDSDPVNSVDNNMQNGDSIIQPNSPNTDEVVRNSAENLFTDVAEENELVAHDDSVNTDDVVRNLVEHTINGESVSLNDPTMYHSSLLDTDDFVRNLVEDQTKDTNSNDELLDSMLESIVNEDELPDSVAVDDTSVLEEENPVLDFDSANFVPDEPNDSTSIPASDRICQLPLGRIRTIVKADPDVNIVSGEVTFLISKSCELFLRWLGKEVHSYTIQKKKKTIQKRDLDLAINEHPALEFLDGALD